MEMDVRSGGRDGRNFEKFSVPDRLASLGVKAPGGGRDPSRFKRTFNYILLCRKHEL